MARVDTRLGRQGENPLHDRALQLLVASARARRTADRALEDEVGGEAVRAVDEEGEVAGTVTGRVDREDLEAARADDIARRERLVHAPPQLPCRRLVRQHRHAEAGAEIRGVDDVVVVVVRQEDVRDRDSVARDALEQGIDDTVAVDQNAVTSGPLRDEIGVREPGRMLGALDDHAVHVTE
jgi:hypothetical protein